jgi:hypothetical protein
LRFVGFEKANEELHDFFEQADGGRHRHNQLPFFIGQRSDADELAERRVPVDAREAEMRNTRPSGGVYMTRKCCEKDTIMANISHLLTQGLTTSSDSLSESAFKALNISTVTKIESDLVGGLKQVESVRV